MFTQDEAILKIASIYFYLAAILMFFDYIQCVIQGTIKALGQQQLASMINFVTYFLIGIPLSYFFAFSETFNPTDGLQNTINIGGIYGLVLGLTLAVVINCTGFLFVVYGPGNVNRWMKAIADASSRQDNKFTMINQSDSFVNADDQI